MFYPSSHLAPHILLTLGLPFVFISADCQWIVFQFEGELDERKFNQFMTQLLQTRAIDIYRCKGVLKFKEKYVSSPLEYPFTISQTT